jgi:hypothetical protein
MAHENTSVDTLLATNQCQNGQLSLIRRMYLGNLALQYKRRGVPQGQHQDELPQATKYLDCPKPHCETIRILWQMVRLAMVYVVVHESSMAVVDEAFQVASAIPDLFVFQPLQPLV